MTTFEKAMVHLSTIIVGLSGILYAVMKYLMTADDPYAVINHPLQPWMLDLHVLTAPALVFAIGLIAQDHVLGQLRKGPNRPGRASGVMALISILPMVSTGYLIQVATEETARGVLVGVHLVTSALYLVAYVAHWFVSRSIAARRKQAARAATASGVWNGQHVRTRVARQLPGGSL